MMRQKKNSNTGHRFAKVRYTEQDWMKLEKMVAATTCQSISEYIRRVTLDKPVVQYFRNASLDELFDECIVLRNEMRGLRQVLPADHSAVYKVLDVQQNIYELIEKIANHVTENQQL